jgi:hypothetical protein
MGYVEFNMYEPTVFDLLIPTEKVNLKQLEGMYYPVEKPHSAKIEGVSRIIRVNTLQNSSLVTITLLNRTEHLIGQAEAKEIVKFNIFRNLTAL